MNDLFTSFWLPLVLQGGMKYQELLDKIVEFNKDFAAYQAEQEEIPRTTKGVHANYAGWPALRKGSKALLDKHNLAIMQHFAGTTEDPQFTVYLRHKNGYIERYDCLAIKSAQYMKPQDFGGLTTYMKRYTYTSILGITDPNEEDLDSMGQPEDVPLCPKCNAPMKFINGKSGPFWGCSLYEATQCRGVREYHKD